ncbi:MAG: lamin tail domain-containing protein [Saprospiraceae bacterium]|nr:lamin tail domain-containing protein [Saprospiraceae bacterium]
MKKFISTAVFLLTGMLAFALHQPLEAPRICQFNAEQPAVAAAPEDIIVINEIMYNNPGVDDYEFIELFNAGDVPRNLDGYQFTTGITFTFPAITLAPGEFVIIAIDSAAFRQAFGVPALQWNTGQALNNTGELITLVNEINEIVDTVRYSASMMPWPTTPNGGGPSLQLCDAAFDNSNGANWRASSQGTGFFINGIEVLATPGAPNDCTPPPPPSYPPYPIGVVTTSDGNGVADSLNVLCQLQGIVYGINLRTTGLQFTIIDGANDGIGVFSTSATFGYTVLEGDEVIIRGRVTQFNGLTQILPDTVLRVSQGNALFSPTTTVQLDESTESQLVRLENLSIVNPAQWTNLGTGFNVDVTNGTNTFQMRVVSTSNVFGTTPPAGAFNLTGLGGQFDTSLPYTEGYQIFPRYLDDFEPISSASNIIQKQEIILSPNPGKGQITVSSTQPFEAIRVTNSAGQIVFFTFFDPVQQTLIDTSKLPAGVYQVMLLYGANRTQTVQMVVR